jgi:antitoxin (DNA-binding transcriptional repressor) of toxin-antitoxin stability system
LRRFDETVVLITGAHPSIDWLNRILQGCRMQIVTVQQVRRSLKSVLVLVEQGEGVQITKRGEVVAVISPPPPLKLRRPKKKDFMARFARIYGPDWEKRCVGKNSIIADRESRPY